MYRAPLKTHRAASGEKIFRQSKQKSARIVDPMRRIFVTNDGKDPVDSLCEGFLEMPFNKLFLRFQRTFFKKFFGGVAKRRHGSEWMQPLAAGIQSRVVTEPQRDRCRQLLRRRRMRVDRVTASSVRQQTYKLQGISKNSPHSESTESFPSFVTKNLRIGSTIRAVFCLD